jgi:hypothetical protein
MLQARFHRIRVSQAASSGSGECAMIASIEKEARHAIEQEG